MKLAKALILATCLSGATPAIAETTYNVGVTITADGISAANGEIYLNNKGVRAYIRSLLYFVPPEVLETFRTGGFGSSQRSVSVSSSSSSVSVASESAGVAVSDMAAAKEAQLSLPAAPALANSKGEVVYDFQSNRRVEIDHEMRRISSKETVYSPANPGKSIIDGAPETASQQQTEALGALFKAFTKPRLDPKREIKTSATGETDVVIINAQSVPCDWYVLSRMGGAYGRACLADPENVPYGGDLRALISGLPLAGAGNDDIVSCARQLSETGKLPVKFYDDRYDLPVTFNRIVVVEEQEEDVTDGDAAASKALEMVEAKIRKTLADYEQR